MGINLRHFKNARSRDVAGLSWWWCERESGRRREDNQSGCSDALHGELLISELACQRILSWEGGFGFWKKFPNAQFILSCNRCRNALEHPESYLQRCSGSVRARTLGVHVMSTPDLARPARGPLLIRHEGHTP